jgi:hypothetical protein
VARQTFQFARCGCTLRVTPQTSYSPDYITPTDTKIVYYQLPSKMIIRCFSFIDKHLEFEIILGKTDLVLW